MLAYELLDLKPQYYCWLREAQSSNAEIVYLIQRQNQVIPIEVKSGVPGRLKSLKIFLDDHKNSEYGVPFYSLNYDLTKNIQNMPLYTVAKVMDSQRELLQARID